MPADSGPPGLAALAASALGREVTGARRLPGGSKKGAYRLRLDDGSSVVGYVWDESEDWWAAVRDPETGPFADASGPELFAAARARLVAAGVRTLQLLALDGRLALVEDLDGGSLADLLDRGAGAAALAELAGMVRALESVRGPRCGKVSGPGHDEPFPALVLDRALRHLDSAAARDRRLADRRDAVERALRERAAAVADRAGYSLVHGELGPDHVRLDPAGHPVLIDIEGLMFADPEWEHAFLEIRFGAHYPALGRPGLDPARLALYRLALALSLVEGPLRLLGTDVPDRDGWQDIAESNLTRVLAAC